MVRMLCDISGNYLIKWMIHLDIIAANFLTVFARIYDFQIDPIGAFRIFTDWKGPSQCLGFAISPAPFQAIEWNWHPNYDCEVPMRNLRIADWDGV